MTHYKMRLHIVLHVLLKIVTKGLVTCADTANDSKLKKQPT